MDKPQVSMSKGKQVRDVLRMTALLEWSEARTPWESKISPEPSSCQFWKPWKRSSWVLMKSESISWCLLCLCSELACACGICTLEKIFWIHGRKRQLSLKEKSCCMSPRCWKVGHLELEISKNPYLLCHLHKILYWIFFFVSSLFWVFPFNKLNYLKCRMDRKVHL